MEPRRNWVNWMITLIASPIILFAFRAPPPPIFPIYSPILNPTHDRDWQRHPYVYQIPPAPKAVLFLAHGCAKSALVFWDAHRGCPQCQGLPEERAFLIQAIQHDFAVIAISSTRLSWSVETDESKVESILRHWSVQHGLHKLPVVALGASTGGWFLAQIAQEVNFQAVVLMVAEGRFMNFTDSYPPVMFVHMEKDVTRAKAIRGEISGLREKGVEVAEVVAREVAISEGFFALRVPGVDDATSGKLVAAMVAGGVVTAEGRVRGDGRWFDWGAGEVEGVVPEGRRALVEQEINVAFGFHEFTSLHGEEILAWLEAKVRARNVTER